MNKTLISTNAQKVLGFLIQNPGRQFLANEIEKATKISRTGVNFSLRKLAKEKLVIREKSHYCLIVALRALYVDKKLLPGSLIESLQDGKSSQLMKPKLN